MSLWFRSRDAWGSVAWPDGRAIIHQPTKLVMAYNRIAHEVAYWDKATE